MSSAPAAHDISDTSAPSLFQPQAVTRRWVRWAGRVLAWAVVVVSCVLGTLVNFIMCQSPAGLIVHRPKPGVCFNALPPELQYLFNGDRMSNLRMVGHEKLWGIPLAIHLEWFVDVETRRDLALNLSPVAALDNPYQATLEDLAKSGQAGQRLVKNEMALMRNRGQIAQSRYGELERHLQEIDDGEQISSEDPPEAGVF